MHPFTVIILYVLVYKSKTFKKHKLPTAAELEKKFDAGDDISEHLDLSTVQSFKAEEERLDLEIKKINLDIPQWMIHRLDQAAEKSGSPAKVSSKCGLQSA